VAALSVRPSLNYHIVEKHGAGSRGVVYKEKSRASVVLWPSSFCPTKLREIRDISKEARKAFIAMEFIDSQSLPGDVQGAISRSSNG
jgi:hypothetical protein